MRARESAKNSKLIAILFLVCGKGAWWRRLWAVVVFGDVAKAMTKSSKI